jgi:hypothetical protein
MQAVESITPAMIAIDGNPAFYEAMLATVSAHRFGTDLGGRSRGIRNVVRLRAST